MYLKKVIQDKIWILGIVLLICSAMTLDNFYFISKVAQNIYYGISFILYIITIIIIRKHYSPSIHHGFLILLNLLLIYVAYLNHIIALPFLLLFPLFYSKKSHWIYKLLSSISYLLLIFIMLSILFVRLIFTSTTLVKTIASPNNKQMAVVYSINEGALGGATDVNLAEKYCFIFKKNRLIYTGGYGEANRVKWIDNNHIQIDSKNIYLTSK
jgi:hypothetical protein